MDFFQTVEEMAAKLVEVLELVAVFCRKIWLRCNDFIFKNQFIHPKKVMKADMIDKRDFSLAHVKVNYDTTHS